MTYKVAEQNQGLTLNSYALSHVLCLFPGGLCLLRLIGSQNRASDINTTAPSDSR